MAKNTNRQTNTGANRPQASAPKANTTTAPKAAGSATGRKISPDWLIAGAIAIITFLFFKVCLNNQFTNWDDPGYIKDNALIKDVSAEGLKNIFSTPVMGNYHPLTILTYALEYSYVRLEPWLYHLDSLLFHIIVTMLVYWFIKLLSRNQVAAGVTALLFGLHPMHVESVAWLAGRKDVVYGMFYMAACIGWLMYIRGQGSARTKWYVAVVLLFLASLLAKPVAVTLPIVLLLIDYYEQRKWNKAVLLEKLPMLAISVAFGIRSMIDQRAFGSLATHSVTYNMLQRVALGGYAFITYLWKAVAPVGLSCFYPYPASADGSIPVLYYIFPLLSIALIAAVWLFARRSRVVVFGALFFIVNIALLLQFLPVGGAIVADRYSYIPYLGLFFMAGMLVARYYDAKGSKTQAGYIAIGIVGAYALVLGYLSNERCQDWYDTTSIWSDEIEKQPNAPNAYNNLGFNYFNKFNESVNPAERKVLYDSSFYFLKKAIELQPTFANPYISLGELNRGAGQYEAARAYYYKGISLGDNDATPNAYLGLAIIYCITHHFDSADVCFHNAITAKPYFPEAHSNYGNYYDMMGRRNEALVEYGLAIAQNPDMYAPYLNRGRCLQRLQRCGEAMKDFEHALQLAPDMGEIYYSRSYCHTQAGNKPLAIQDVQKAQSLGFTNMDPKYVQMLMAR